MSNRRRHIGSRDAPEKSTVIRPEIYSAEDVHSNVAYFLFQCLGVFGLSLYTTEKELEKEFSRFGPLERVNVVLDGKVSLGSKYETWPGY